MRNLENLKKDAEDALKAAKKNLAEVYIALASEREEIGDYQGASMFYFDAGTQYRDAGASKKLIDAADESYRRCRDILPARFEAIK